MAIISTAYFIGELNLSLGTEDSAAITSVWIPRYENDYLYKALGYGFARLFIDGIAEETPDQKWVDLRDGKEYEVGDVTYKWEGFKNAVTLKSPIANYVYAHYLTNKSTFTGGTGEVQSTSQNAVNAGAGTKIHRAWCDMLQMNESLYHYLTNNASTYTEFEYSQVKCFGSLNSFNF